MVINVWSNVQIWFCFARHFGCIHTIRPYHMRRVQGCGLLLLRFMIRVIVSLSVCVNRSRCRLDVDSGWPKESCIRHGPGSPQGRGNLAVPPASGLVSKFFDYLFY